MTTEQYFRKHSQWESALRQLHECISATELDCKIKWGAPVYDLDGKNVIGLGAFKHHFGVWFFQGVFLKDEAKVLVNAQEGKTKALRQWKFQDESEIDLDLLKRYVLEAIQNQKEGKQVEIKRNAEFKIPQELQSALKQDKTLKIAFEDLTKGKQKEYANYIQEAKREATKLNRLEKVRPMILNGVGLHDQYKNC